MIRRHLEPLLLEALRAFPVVVVTGARQVGKSTLVQALCQHQWNATYLTLDDRPTLEAALADPDDFIAASPGPLAIDEVQRAPDLLRAIKLSVDRRRHPGRFLLTGSANLLTLKTVTETLAGRVVLYQLHPFSYAELMGDHTPSTLLQRLFHAPNSQAAMRLMLKTTTHVPRPADFRQRFLDRILQGSYPIPALSKHPTLRPKWFEAYRQTYLERDVLDLQAIERRAEFSRLMTLTAWRTGQVLNVADLGREVGLPYVTLRRYLHLLEQTYQLITVAPFFVNVSTRLAKAPKLYWTDTGMACHLLDLHDFRALHQHPRLGALVETWVAQELLKLFSVAPEPIRLYGWRLRTGQEVDFLVEQGGRLLAIEVKSGRQVDRASREALKTLEARLGKRLLLGMVLYTGEELLPLGPKWLAMPYELLFRGGCVKEDS
jgi:predicted AAA+ superfamily ATPase